MNRRLVNPRLRFIENPPAGDAGAGGGAPVVEDRKFTQADLDRVATREKDQGARAALKAKAEGLGFATVEEMETFVTKQREEAAKNLTEQQRKEQELAAREAALSEKERAAAEKAARATRKEILVGLGTTGVDLEDALALLNVPADADDAAITAAAEALKTRRPELFPGTVTKATPPRPATGAPGSKPPANGGTVPPKEGARGEAEAARRFASRQPQKTGASA